MDWTRIGQIVPTISSEDIQNGVRILITFNEVTRALADVLHGKDGKDGKDGSDGEDGQDGDDGTHDVLSALITEEEGSSRIELFKQTHSADGNPLWAPESLGEVVLPYGKSLLSIGFYRIDVEEEPQGYLHFSAQWMCATEWDDGIGTFQEVGDPIDLAYIKIPFAPLTIVNSLDWVELTADYGTGQERIGFWQRALRPVLSNQNDQKLVTMDLIAYDGMGGDPVISQSYSWKDAYYALENASLSINQSSLSILTTSMGGQSATSSIELPSPSYQLTTQLDNLLLNRDGQTVSTIDNFRQRFKYWLASDANDSNIFELIEQEYLATSPVGDAVSLFRYEPVFDDGIAGLGLKFTADKTSLTIVNNGLPVGDTVNRDSFGMHYRYRLVWSSENRRYELWARAVSSAFGDGDEFLASHAICCFDDPSIQFEEMLKDVIEELLLGGLLDAYFGTKSLPPKDLKEGGGWGFKRLLDEFNEVEIPAETKAALAAIVLALAAAYLAPVAIPATAGSEAVLGASIGGLGLATLVPADGQLSIWQYPSSFWDSLVDFFGGGSGGGQDTSYTTEELRMIIAGGLSQTANWLTGSGQCDLPVSGKPLLAQLTSEQLASANQLANTIKFQGWQYTYPSINLQMLCNIESLEQAISAFSIIANTNTNHALHRLFCYMMRDAPMSCFERLLSYAELLDIVPMCTEPDPMGGYGTYDLTAMEYSNITYTMPSYNPTCTWELGKGIRSTNQGGTWNGKHVIVCTVSLPSIPQSTYIDVSLEWDIGGFTSSSVYRVNSGYEGTIQQTGILTTLSDYESTGSQRKIEIYADTKVDVPSYLRKIIIQER